MVPSRRLELIPPYLFAELERRIAAKRAEGVDVISLGIGDPDQPTPSPIVEAAREALADPSLHRYPTNRGRTEFREAVAAYYRRRFGVHLDPEREVIPAIGAKEALFNLNLAFLDAGDYALAADPGYPVYSAGPVLVGAAVHHLPLLPERGFTPDLEAVPAAVLKRAKLLYLNYPNNPTAAVVPAGFFEQVVDFAHRHRLLVVHDNAYSDLTYDGYRAPSFLASPGAKEVGVEVYSLSKGFNMTGWRCAAVVGNAAALEAYWRLKTNIDSGLFEVIQLAGVRALASETEGAVETMRALYARRRDRVCAALARIGIPVAKPRATIYIWAPVPRPFASSGAFCEHVLERAAVVLSPGAAYGPSGEGWFRISLTTPEPQLEEALSRLAKLA